MGNVAYAVNSQTYEAKYQIGYGLEYPDGHVIRFHRQILEYELGMTSGTILDYGCGIGAHLQYFAQHGFTPYGCDINAEAIAKCKSRMPAHAEHFHVIPYVPQLRDYFPMEFDIVFSNQVLEYFNNRDVQNMLSQFSDLLKGGGVLFVTWIAPTNYYARWIVDTRGEMSRVVLRGRLEETQFVNFKTQEQLLELFQHHGVTKLHMGFYSATIREDEGPTDRYMFVGRKEPVPH